MLFIHSNYLSKHYLGTVFLLLQREGKKALTSSRIPFSSLSSLCSIEVLKVIDRILTSVTRDNFIKKL